MVGTRGCYHIRLDEHREVTFKTIKAKKFPSGQTIINKERGESLPERIEIAETEQMFRLGTAATYSLTRQAESQNQSIAKHGRACSLLYTAQSINRFSPF